MTRRVVIVGGGPAQPAFVASLIAPTDTVIAADGGAETLRRAGIRPQLLLGDLDSVSADTVEELRVAGVPIHRFGVNKDRTDLDLALEWAIGMGPDEILVLGALGCRLDHTLTNVALLAAAASAGIGAGIADQWGTSYLTSGNITIRGRPGDIVSLVPLSPVVEGITTRGLHYPLRDEPLAWGTSEGIHNVMLGERAHVSVRGGWLLVTLTSDHNAGGAGEKGVME